jgi:hypothetical protein
MKATILKRSWNLCSLASTTLIVIAAVPGITEGSATASQGGLEAPADGEALVGRAEALDGCLPDPPVEPERYTCITKCAIEGQHADCTGWVIGEGTDKTEPDACKAAVHDANRRVGELHPGKECKAKHCRPCQCEKKR